MTVTHDQITEVSVVGNEDSPFGMGKCQDLVVSQTGSIVARDSRRVEAECTEMVCYSGIAALVNQKSEDTRQDVHAWAATGVCALTARRTRATFTCA